jgi:hypothetical protein
MPGAEGERMFGYITADRDEMKGKDYDRYRAFYCGVCRDLGDGCGQASRLTLTYDMAFLAILLTGLYEAETEVRECGCILHPLTKRKVIRNEYTAYAADMCILLAYHDLTDDWADDRKLSSLVLSKAVRRAYLDTAAKYPDKIRAIRKYLRSLQRAELTGDEKPDVAAHLTGDLMAEIFAPKEDVWAADLRALGFCLGRFIYLMDAFDDLEEDERKGSYNPFRFFAGEDKSEEKIRQILSLEAAGAARAFERLPILAEADILRNILYSGIWTKYRRKVVKDREAENPAGG